MSAGDLQATAPGPGILERLVVNLARRAIAFEPKGSIAVRMPSGRVERLEGASGGVNAQLSLANFRLIGKALRRGALGFAEAYLDRDIDTPDLTAVFRYFLANEHRFEQAGGRLFRARIIERFAHWLRRNSIAGSKRNIAEHYDLGNEFFAAWLDPGMNYSSGYYGEGATTLEQAQSAKLDLILDMLGTEAGQRVLEIGCGWGAFSRRAALRGCNVTGLTLSAEQLAHARQTAREQGLEARCDYQLRDYRDETGSYDRVASIEMIEAVGLEYWPAYFGAVADRLEPGGVAVIQAITIEEKRFETYSRSPDFIQRYIFPGGMLLTHPIMERAGEAAGLTIERVENFGQSYARTLAEWRRRFEDAWPAISALGFSERFRRMWRYYLCYCEAGFLDGAIDVGAYRYVKRG